ncbi:uncharacterized protein UTRI_04852_B [Ustilago trichophora]|uniref:Uncharacterized protein n=1 Tax=Ustilago trichophora TaxID=86804 RepID=A0A5C3EGB4_9BASI|nr:uncharacterized protein UTRI_04852_B [Ustilago trichophora]
MDSPAHESTRQFVQQSGAAIFTLDGERGSGKSQLCAKMADGRLNCTEIALEEPQLLLHFATGPIKDAHQLPANSLLVASMDTRLKAFDQRTKLLSRLVNIIIT